MSEDAKLGEKGQWENYLLTRLAFGGYSKSYGLTQEQMPQPRKELNSTGSQNPYK
ncbi:MAG: hypothetical protein V7K25_02555 [Nostoc sp.]|uniref:hypothetical protein n=1 Tax=Nostoc sp. TaxID=1180 RepID=UPI002FF4436E